MGDEESDGGGLPPEKTEKFPYVEFRKDGMRYLATTMDRAELASQPCKIEDPNTPYGRKIAALKAYACAMAGEVAPGVVDLDFMRARELTRSRLTFGEEPELLRDWQQEDIYRNAAILLHFLFNVLGFTYADEERVAQIHTDILEGRFRL